MNTIPALPLSIIDFPEIIVVGDETPLPMSYRNQVNTALLLYRHGHFTYEGRDIRVYIESLNRVYGLNVVGGHDKPLPGSNATALRMVADMQKGRKLYLRERDAKRFKSLFQQAERNFRTRPITASQKPAHWAAQEAYMGS